MYVECNASKIQTEHHDGRLADIKGQNMCLDLHAHISVPMTYCV